MTRKGIFVAATVAALLALGAGFTTGMQMRAEDTAAIGSIKDSYAFDVKNKRLLMSYATEAFVAEVIGVERTEEPAATTVWRVRIVQSVKGSRTGEVLVRQLGYIDSDRRPHVTEEQPLLVPGSRRLLVTTRAAGATENMLIAGPAASVDASGQGRQAQLVKEYQLAMK